MTVVVDINVMLDVFLRRQPHYMASAAVMSAVASGTLQGVCPAHALTTLYYLASKFGSRGDAESAVDEVLQNFEIVSLDKAGWKRVRGLPMTDFEDAAIALSAEENGAAFVITRNEADFVNSPVPAINPASFLGRFMPKP